MTTNEAPRTANSEAGVDNEENPHGLTPFLLNSGLEVYGARIGRSWLDIDPVAHVKNVRALNIREDDVLIAAFPKCGTHWIWEITQMLLNHTTQFETRTKEHLMLEFSYTSSIDAQPSPRILNSHLWFCHLPQEIIAKRTKIIHIVRNPKDTLVSFYHHMLQGPHDGRHVSFDSLLKAYMANDLRISHQFDYLRQMREFEKAHPDHPIKLVYYEEMKKDPAKLVKELAEFLKVPATDEFCEEVVSACSFDKMKAADGNRDFPELMKKQLKDGQAINFYRKGTIGDWKNHFTVAQNEMFDDLIARETASGLDYTFIYE